MIKTILTSFQEELFKIFCRNKFITKNFYFTGGTALAEIYLKHRFSQDLDFFTDKKLVFEGIETDIGENLKKAKINSFDYRAVGMAKIFFFRKGKKEIVKTDFDYFPFKRLAKGKAIGLLEVDSLLDIAVNKLHTILTRGLARDFVDFYFIQQKQKYSLYFLLEKLKKKFLWQVDPLFLGSRLIKIKDLVDYPVMIEKFSKREMIDYFFELGRGLKKKIFF